MSPPFEINIIYIYEFLKIKAEKIVYVVLFQRFKIIIIIIII